MDLWTRIRATAWKRSLFLYEFAHLGGFLWWWRLRWAFFREFRGFDEIESAQVREQIYGEIPPITVTRLLGALHPHGRVVDLGSGRGLPALTAASLGFRSVGVEKNGEMVERARRVGRALKLPVEWIRADFSELTLRHGDLYLSASTAFSPATRQLLLKVLQKAPRGALLVVSDWRIEQPTWLLLEEFRLPVDWGLTHFRLYRHQPGSGPPDPNRTE